MAQLLVLTVDDTAPDLTGTVNATLVGATAQVHVRRPDRTVVTNAADIADGGDGAWAMTWQDGDLDQPGVYEVELEVTFSNNQVQTFGPALIEVREQIA